MKDELEELKDQLVDARYEASQSGVERDYAHERIEQALYLATQYGGTDGAHHKQWVIDQMVRKLTRDEYGAWLADYQAGDDGPETYSWDEGIAP